MFIGIEDIYGASDQKEKKRSMDRFHGDFKNAKQMIRKESGVTDIDNLFKTITKAKHSSRMIEYYRKLSKESNAKKK